MTRPKPDKQPGKGAGLTWGRTAREDGTLVYRLFRRDRARRVHQFNVVCEPGTALSLIGARLRDSKRRLRDQVDEVDLGLMEKAA